MAAACENPPEGIKELIAAALRTAFPKRAGADSKLGQRIDNAFADCAHYYRMSAPARTRMSSRPPVDAHTDGAPRGGTLLCNPRFLALVYPEEFSGAIDFLNREHRPWQYPRRPSNAAAPDRNDTRSFPEVYSGAVEAAACDFLPFITEYADSGVFPFDQAAECIGNSGLSIQDDEGKPAAPNRSDPLPLDSVLWRQAELRGLP